MPNESKVIAFDVDQASLTSLRRALPDSVIEVLNGAMAASLTRDWNPGTVDLVVVKARKEAAETLELCRFLVSCGVIAKDAPAVTDSQEECRKRWDCIGVGATWATGLFSASCPGAPQQQEHRKGRVKGGRP